MDLFAAAGVDTPRASRGAPVRRHAGMRSLRVPLFNHRALEEARQRAAFAPGEAELAAAKAYARRVRGAKFGAQKETAVRNLFFDEVLGQVLGYRRYEEEGYTLAIEYPIRGGSVDAALGRFSPAQDKAEVIAPVEAKGPGADLDAIPAGRGRSPVQQAWDYAIDTPGSRFVLVTNCVELRLYAFGRGRDAYEVFDLAKLDDPDEHARLWLVLHADRLLGGATDALLRASDVVAKAITDDFYASYKDLRDRLLGFLTGEVDGPKLPLASAIEQTQKVLDRILFVAFAQRNDLLPEELLERTAKADNPFAPTPLWENFKGLFGYLNRGHFDLDITAYNGGLFAPDPIADALLLPEHLVKDLVALGAWDYRREVSAAVLGHIFEQSITDIEKLRAESEGRPAPDEKRGRRKREGVVYTPDTVTRFLVERTLGVTLAERFSALLREHAGIGAPPKNGDAIPWREGEASERAFWRAYLAALRETTVVDPACGSGAFLVAAFDLFAREYRQVTDRLAALGEPVDFDPLDWIVTRNLYGVDLNAESVEITRLSLWLKTARRKHRLQNLEATIKAGNSLIESGEYTRHPFDWQAAFPDVFARGGFDVVIGNPPYVRMEFLKEVKPYLEERYRVAADRTDLYAYFFEKGVDLLKPGGRLGYISSSTFFRTGSGEKLRLLLAEETAIEAVIDFGDEQIFEGVTTYPAILTLRRPFPSSSAGGAKRRPEDPGPSDDGTLRFLKLDGPMPKELSGVFDMAATAMPRARLTGASWQFEEDALARLRAKIVAGRKTLGEVYGAPLYGIKTGLNAAFIINQETRDRLVVADQKSEELLRPILRGEDVRRWGKLFASRWLLLIPSGWTRNRASKRRGDDLDEHSAWNALESVYPAIASHLRGFEEKARKRSDQGEYWWELRACSYYDVFSKPKIIYPYLMRDNSFCLDHDGYFTSKTTYLIPSGSSQLTAYLNSKAAWFLITAATPPKAGGYREIMTQYLEHLVLPSTSERDDKKLAELGKVAGRSVGKRFETQAAVRRRILDLAPAERRKLSRKLESWWELDFAGFLAEVKRAFKLDLPLRQRGEWEGYLAENRATVRRLTAEIEAAEREIDAIVYRLFDLTPEEIVLLEASLEGQY